MSLCLGEETAELLDLEQMWLTAEDAAAFVLEWWPQLGDDQRFLAGLRKFLTHVCSENGTEWDMDRFSETTLQFTTLGYKLVVDTEEHEDGCWFADLRIEGDVCRLFALLAKHVPGTDEDEDEA